ncbi:replication regulatory protein RepA [Lelliottia nimipressuralis]|uniref:Protein CopB n=1 Tax=Lelliottia nimipressuralis TaxID=69220 RepID=A0ABD4KES8_9ENTR|nr:replication regulatory protein RepA [Lelliottia nimipressuralis]MBF4180366.1 replication regulatory protein RepA [Lelliottia nimipressuralis]RXJ10750.1 replication regulatory protein RepA [Lelliottia nimipressuralis]TYT29252.1 replication regulatory protein RepA [Lelliottia nimipressuralis]
MSQAANVETSSAKPKRSYRKGQPLTASERQLASVARKRETHKEIKVFVRKALKDRMLEVCEAEGLTQAEFIETLLERELAER